MSDKDLPAFPTDSHESPFVKSSAGMTLRDYFAAKALQGFIVSGEYRWNFETRAEKSYEMADAMLEARK